VSPKRSTTPCRYARARKSHSNLAALEVEQFNPQAHPAFRVFIKGGSREKGKSMELKLEIVSTIIEQFKTLGNQGRQSALFDFIHGLPDQQKAELTAIIWVGRDYPEADAEFFTTLVEHAKGQQVDDTANYLFSKERSLVIEWLSDGLRTCARFLKAM
jgi:hypothetical protein